MYTNIKLVEEFELELKSLLREEQQSHDETEDERPSLAFDSKPEDMDKKLNFNVEDEDEIQEDDEKKVINEDSITKVLAELDSELDDEDDEEDFNGDGEDDIDPDELDDIYLGNSDDEIEELSDDEIEDDIEEKELGKTLSEDLNIDGLLEEVSTLNEKANFAKLDEIFRKNKDLSKYGELLDHANDILERDDFNKAERCVYRILELISDITLASSVTGGSVAAVGQGIGVGVATGNPFLGLGTTALMLLLVASGALVNRLIRLLIDHLQVESATKVVRRTIARLEASKGKAKDEKTKKEIDKMIDKLEDNLKSLSEECDTESLISMIESMNLEDDCYDIDGLLEEVEAINLEY